MLCAKQQAQRLKRGVQLSLSLALREDLQCCWYRQIDIFDLKKLLFAQKAPTE
jgi:hypothetical protein